MAEDWVAMEEERAAVVVTASMGAERVEMYTPTFLVGRRRGGYQWY
jgi:hypothetical protein